MESVHSQINYSGKIKTENCILILNLFRPNGKSVIATNICSNSRTITELHYIHAEKMVGKFTNQSKI